MALRLMVLLVGFAALLSMAGATGAACLNVARGEEAKTVFSVPVKNGAALYLDFVNSVDLAPVRETYQYRAGEGLWMIKVESPSAGVFEYYRIEPGPDNSAALLRHVGTISLRNHDYWNHVLTVDGKIIPLRGLAMPGELVTIAVNDAKECEREETTRPNVRADSRSGPFGRNEEDVNVFEREGLKRFGINPVSARNGNLFGERGTLGEPIRAQSGERLEIRWEGFFPRYRLYYFPSPKHRGVVIGECRFPDGCNNGFFFGPDTDGDGIPDSFRLVQWVSSDYGGDDEVPGYLDRYRYIYDVQKDRHYMWHDLLFYRCLPPLTTSQTTCTTTCDPPYEERTVGNKTYPRIFKTDLVKEKRLLRQE